MYGGYQPGYAPSYGPPPGPPPPPWSGGPPGQQPSYFGNNYPHYQPPPGPPPGNGYPGSTYRSDYSQPSGYPSQEPYTQRHYAPPEGPPPLPPRQQQYYGPQYGTREQPAQPYFEYSQCNGKKKGLFIGINYFGQNGELRGCINDVENITEFLMARHGYNKEDMVILTDDANDPIRMPTKENIIRAMHWLVAGAAPHDSLFFHYSGHGGQTKDLDGDEDDGYDEVIYPVDFQEAGHIVDDDMHDIMVKPLPPGCRLTAIYDSCHSGTALDLPYVYSTEGKIKEPNLYAEAGQDILSGVTAYARGDMGGLMSSAMGLFKTATGRNSEARQVTIQTKTSPADVISWSGCKDSQTSADTQEAGLATGAMSHAFVSALTHNPEQSYQQLLVSIREILSAKYSQKPQLSCSHPMSSCLTDRVPNLDSKNFDLFQLLRLVDTCDLYQKMEWQDEDYANRQSNRGFEARSHEGYNPGYAPSYGQQSYGGDEQAEQTWNYGGQQSQQYNYGQQQTHHYNPPSGPPPGARGDEDDYPGHRYHSESQQYGGDNQGYGQQHYAPPSGPPPMPPSQEQHYGPQAEGQGPSQLSFQYSQCNGRKKGLFIGINYFGQNGQLGGCINDVENITEFLISRYGYHKENMVILTDDQEDPRRRPTRDNMLRAMEWLVSDAAPNDSLFFHYSGHGGQTRDKDGDEEDANDEVIYPVDYQEAGHIVDDDMHKIMVNPLPAGCRLTAIFDSCHSGSVLDLPYMYSTEGKIKEPNLYAEAGQDLLAGFSAYTRGDNQGLLKSAMGLFKTVTGKSNEAHEITKKTRTSPADVITWSGCKDSQTSADTQEGGEATGAMSHAFVSALNHNSEQSYQQLLVSIRGILQSKYSQKPQLSCSHPMDVDLRFIC